MFLIRVTRGVTTNYQGSIFECDGTTAVQLAANDVVRIKIYTQDQSSPVLDLDSVSPSANGSSVTIDSVGSSSPATAAQYTLRLDQDDTVNLDRPIYGVQVAVVDESTPDDDFLEVEPGTLAVTDGPAGDKGLS